MQRSSETTRAVIARDDHLDRICKDIPESSCTAYPVNARLNVLNGAAGKLAEQLCSAKLILPWVMSALGATPALIGLLAPIRQAGALVPQLAISGQLRQFPIRKWFWVASALVQILALGSMIGAVWLLKPEAAVVVILLLSVPYSMSRGVGSISFQDVVGKTLPKGRRGKVLAARGAIGGLLTLGAGLLIGQLKGNRSDLAAAIILIGISMALWALAAIAFAAIREQPGATAGGRNPLKETRFGFQLMKSRQWFRRFIVVRGLLLTVEMGLPFYVLYAHQLFGDQSQMLGLLVVVAGLSQTISAPFWGRFADTASDRVMTMGGLMAAGAAAMAIAIAHFAPNPYLFGSAILLLGVAESGVLLGRKTYLVDTADPDERPTYVAFSNSLMGLIALCFGVFGWVAAIAGIDWVLVIMGLAALTGGLLALGLSPLSSAPAARLPSQRVMPHGGTGGFRRS